MISVFSIINPLIVSAQTGIACIDVYFDPGAPKPDPAEGCPDVAAPGEIPSADRTALLQQISTFINNGTISFSHDNDKNAMLGNGIVQRRVGTGTVEISTKALRMYVYMANQGFKFNVSSMIGGHSRCVKGSSPCRESAHWSGRGVDINNINDFDIDTNRSRESQNTLKNFMIVLNNMPTEISPRQIICSGNGVVDSSVLALQKGVSGIVDGHLDHVHIGY